MKPRLGFLALLLLLLAAAAPAALAGPGDARKAHTTADQARARAVVLGAGDLPGTGWKGERDTNDSRLRCASFDPDLSDLTETGDADSPTFTRSSGTIVASSATVYATEAQANAAYDRVVKPGMLGCVSSVLERSGDKTTTIDVVSSGTLAHPRRGDESHAYRISARLRTGGQTIPFAFDIVLVRRARIDLVFMAGGVGEAVPAAVEARLTALLDRRLAAAA